MANISSYLNTIRTAASGESVRTAIVNCLNAINRDNPVTVQGKTITANGTYTAEGGIAFNPVTVQVPTGGPDSYNFQDIEITENGEYQAEEENTYFDKVTVAVPQFANDLMEERKILSRHVYLSLGDREERARNPVMATVGDRMRAAYALLQARGMDCVLEWNEGNHFTEPEIRTAKGFAWCFNALIDQH